MILYHGSTVKVDVIDLEKSKPFKDFGKGFYLSDSETQAKEMANFKASLFDEEAVISKFMFDKDALLTSDLNIKIFKEYTDEWLDFVIAIREGDEVENFDFVYGPIADDKVGLQLRRFKDGSIDKHELLNRLKYIKGITFQYFFGTEDSIKYLKSI